MSIHLKSTSRVWRQKRSIVQNELNGNKYLESNYVNYLISGLLIAFGWSGVIPAIHLVSTYEATLVMRQVAVEWIILMSFLYTASAVTYATRIPERFFPGKCDIWVSYFYNVEKFQS